MLLPLVPSTHPSARAAEGLLDVRQAACLATLQRDRHTCRFCGLPAGSWRDVFHRNDDHTDWSPDNLAAACPLCHAVQHIGSASASSELRVIWLPEVTQNLLNVLVRRIHRILHGHGLPPTFAQRPVRFGDDLGCAWRVYAALARRAVSARSVIDTDNPRDLAAALQALSPGNYARRAELLGGLRLLHRGRSIRQGKDTYPTQLDHWSDIAGTAAFFSPPPTTPTNRGSAACSVSS